jgi:hypothetical protein
MISFRVSEHEFELLKVRSEAEGARSLSDYARLALCHVDRVPYNRVDPAVHQLSDEIQQLRAHLLHMTELLANPRRTAAAQPTLTLASRSVSEKRENAPARAGFAGQKRQ